MLSFERTETVTLFIVDDAVEERQSEPLTGVLETASLHGIE